MPMTNEQIDELTALLAVAKKRQVNFGLCLGKKPEDTVFVLHRMKGPEILGREAKKDGDTTKVAFGVIDVTGKKALLTCQSDIPAGIAKATKKFLTGIKNPLKITVLDATGAMIEDDGDPEEPDEEQDTGAAAPAAGEAPPPPPPPPPSPQEAAWARIEAALGPLVQRYVASGADKAAAVKAAWDGAVKAAADGKYDAAMAVAQKVRPYLDGSAPAADTPAPAAAPAPAPSPDQQRFDSVIKPLQALFDRAIALEPAEEDALRKGWATMEALAERGDHAGALKAAGVLKPALDAAIAAGAAAEAFQATYLRVADLFSEAMKFNPPNRTQLEAAWATVSTLGFDRKNYPNAEAAAAKVEAALRQAIAAGQLGAPSDQTIPPDVAPYAKARIGWANARSTMRVEVGKLEAAIIAKLKDDPELAEMTSEVGSLSKRLDVFTDELEDSLDAVVNSAPGPERERLKQAAIAALTKYREALQDEFFRDVDGGNGFVPVDVAGAADRALLAVETALAA